MPDITCELHVAERIKKKTILKRFLKLSRSSSFNSHDVIDQEVGAAANGVWETFLVTKKQQMS